MPSRRRSRSKNLGTSLSDVQRRMRYLERRPVRTKLQRKIVTAVNIAPETITPDEVNFGTAVITTETDTSNVDILNPKDGLLVVSSTNGSSSIYSEDDNSYYLITDLVAQGDAEQAALDAATAQEAAEQAALDAATAQEAAEQATENAIEASAAATAAAAVAQAAQDAADVAQVSATEANATAAAASAEATTAAAAAGVAQSDATLALANAATAFSAATSSLQPSANTIVNASNQITAIKSNGITVFSGANADSGPRVVLNSLGLAGFDASGSGIASFSISASTGAAVFRGNITTGATITGGTLNIAGKTIINDAGLLTGTDVTLTGDIRAEAGYFGTPTNGFSINSTGLVGVGTGTIVGGTIQGVQFTNGGTFSVSPTGFLIASNAEITGTIKASSGYFGTLLNGFLINETGLTGVGTGTITGGAITGATISLTGNQTGSGSDLGGGSFTETSDTSNKLNFTAANYSIIPALSTRTYRSSTPTYDPAEDVWGETFVDVTDTSRTIKITDTTLKGAIPSSGFYYGETYIESGSDYGGVTMYSNYPGGFISFEVRASSTEQSFYIRGEGANWTNQHPTTAGADQPTYLQADSSGRITRGRSIFTSGANSTTIQGPSWSGVGQNGDLAFSTNN